MKPRWEEFTSKISPRSNLWASTDRGWLYHGEQCLGHYLDYGPVRPDGRVHAVVCGLVTSEASSTNTYVTRASAHFDSVRDARAWIEQEAGATAPASALEKWRDAKRRVVSNARRNDQP